MNTNNLSKDILIFIEYYHFYGDYLINNDYKNYNKNYLDFYRQLYLNDLDIKGKNDLIISFYKYFGEFVGLYYILKYLDNIPNYIGICQYNKIINFDVIDFSQIDINKIQIFDICTLFNKQPNINNIDELSTYKIPILKNYSNKWLKSYKYFNNELMYDDVIEFINNQTLIDKNIFYNSCRKIIYPNIDCIIMTKDILEDIVNFILEYIHFILNKYSINNCDDMELHIVKNLLMIPDYYNVYNIYSSYINILIGLYINAKYPNYYYNSQYYFYDQIYNINNEYFIY